MHHPNSTQHHTHSHLPPACLSSHGSLLVHRTLCLSFCYKETCHIGLRTHHTPSYLILHLNLHLQKPSFQMKSYSQVLRVKTLVCLPKNELYLYRTIIFLCLCSPCDIHSQGSCGPSRGHHSGYGSWALEAGRLQHLSSLRSPYCHYPVLNPEIWISALTGPRQCFQIPSLFTVPSAVCL